MKMKELGGEGTSLAARLDQQLYQQNFERLLWFKNLYFEW